MSRHHLAVDFKYISIGRVCMSATCPYFAVFFAKKCVIRFSEKKGIYRFILKYTDTNL